MIRYHVGRNGKKLGVYPEDQIRQYIAEGRIGPNDLLWREGMETWMPPGQLFGQVTQPAALGGLPPPLPPKLHWALVLLFGLVTLGLFFLVWIFIQSRWVRRIDPRSNATALLAVYLVLTILGQLTAGGEEEGGAAILGSVLVLAGAIASIIAMFSMRRSMLDYYNQVEPIGLKLSGILTFFLNVFYLQHHMTRIARWKQTGELTPQ